MRHSGAQGRKILNPSRPLLQNRKERDFGEGEARKDGVVILRYDRTTREIATRNRRVMLQFPYEFYGASFYFYFRRFPFFLSA